MSGRKSGIAASNSAASRLTHPARTISLVKGSARLFVAPDPLTTLWRSRLRKWSVLPGTLISRIRSNWLAIADSYDSLQSSGKAADGHADEL
jgi:hypothetical protein